MDLNDLFALNDPEEGWPTVRSTSDLMARGPVLVGRLPDGLIPDAAGFERLWDLHPKGFNSIAIYDKKVPLPRWQQPYAKDYVFSGQNNPALQLPDILKPFLEWAQGIDPLMNGVLLNWYDAKLKHYIGGHRDSTTGLVVDTPIITVSLGATRSFRLRKARTQGFEDIEVTNGDVVVLPWETNLAYTHEVPHLEKYSGQRISVTMRAFFDAR